MKEQTIIMEGKSFGTPNFEEEARLNRELAKEYRKIKNAEAKSLSLASQVFIGSSEE